MMRSTVKITNSQNLHYLQKNGRALAKVSAQIAGMQQVNNLEDDPLAATYGTRMITMMSRVTQYTRNITFGKGMLDQSDQNLQSTKKLIDKLYTLVEGASNSGATTPDQVAANQKEAETLLKSILSAANFFDGERYTFGGHYTGSEPFQIVNGRYVHYKGDDKNINMEVDHGSTQAVNVTGKDAFGNMTTVIKGSEMNPDVCLSSDRSTPISALNGGSGVPKGKIMVYYSAYPEGLEVDLSNCDNLEDVKDAIEKQTLEASRLLHPNKDGWLDGSTLDWHDLQDRYVQVSINPEHNGISLQEIDLGEPLPEPNKQELKAGVNYSGNSGYPVDGGGYGVADDGTGGSIGSTTVYDKRDSIYGDGFYTPLRVDDSGKNKVAEGLGIKGTANTYNPRAPDRIMDGFLHGKDLDPVLSGSTLLADVDGYNDGVYTFNNGAKPGAVAIREMTSDAQNVFNAWNLSGLSFKNNTGDDGDLYARVTRRDEPENDIFVEIYSKPISKAGPGDLVATGSYDQSTTGGTVIISEANNSGISGTVGIILASNAKEAQVNLKADFESSTNIQDTIHVPAFVEETGGDGRSKDIFNIASGWHIRGLDKPPAEGFDLNHPATTDLEGNVAVNYRYDEDSKRFMVEIYRPAYGDQPAKKIASGYLPVDTVPTDKIYSGRIEITGEPGFEGVGGSVYIELPQGASFSGSTTDGSSAAEKTNASIVLQQDADDGSIVVGGSKTLTKNQAVGDAFDLTGEATFKTGQVFNNYVTLPDGSKIPAGAPLTGAISFPAGFVFKSDVVLPDNTVLTAGNPVPAGGVTFPKDHVFAEDVLLEDNTVWPAGNPLQTDITLSKGATIDVDSLLTGTVLSGGQDIILVESIKVTGNNNVLQKDLIVDGGRFLMKGPTTFKAGQIFDMDITLPKDVTLANGTVVPAGSIWPAGTALVSDITLPVTFKKGESYDFEINLPDGTVIPKNTRLTQDYAVPADGIVELDNYPLKSGTILTIGQEITLKEETFISIPGAMTLVKNQQIASPLTLAGDTTFKAGQGFTSIILPDGTDLAAPYTYPDGTTGPHPYVKEATDVNGNLLGYMVLRQDTVLPAGTEVDLSPGIRDHDLLEGTVLAGGQEITFIDNIAAGTAIPAGSYYTSAGGSFGVAAKGASSTDPLDITYQLQSDAPAGNIHLGGALELLQDQQVSHSNSNVPPNPMVLAGDVLFQKGQVFTQDVYLPDGGVIRAGVPLHKNYVFPKGTQVSFDEIKAGTILPAGQSVNFTAPLPAGTVIPRGSYYDPAGGGFPVDNMGIVVTDPITGQTREDHPGGYNLTATFATIEDFNRAVEEAGIYVKSQISSDGKRLEFVSTLAGAYLTVSEDTDCYEQMNDKYEQLSGLDLTGLVKGVNTDNYGNTYTEVIYYPPDPEHPERKVTLVSDTGDLIEVDPGYYVRVYSDKASLDKSYENRDNASMIAEGFIPAGEWNPKANPYDELNYDPTYLPGTPGYQPFLPAAPETTLGMAKGLVLEERNNSGVYGSVNLDYYGNQEAQAEYRTRYNPKTEQMESYIEYNPWHNDELTVFPGGLRPEGTKHTAIQQWDLVDVTPGISCDYSGTFHGKVSRDDSLPAHYRSNIQLALYKDSSNTTMTARNDPESDAIGPDGKVRLYKTNANGTFILDNNGDKIPAGSMVIDTANLPDATTDKFTLTTGAARHGGQEREENLFTTINDVLDALAANDDEKLNSLLGSLTKDLKRIEAANGDAAARSARLKLLTERHADDLVTYGNLVTQKIGMDEFALSTAIMNKYAAQNAYDAAMQIAATINQMSLLDYLR